ncbi:hypothetical protein [Pontiella sp.]|uniref:hypothetical protein n=1 Tax=Pontiella sp. TaxID=2837462 RepID=UPI003562FA81
MNDTKVLSISIIIASVVISIPLWKNGSRHPAPATIIELPDDASIKQQVERISSTGKVEGFRYSIDKTKLLLDVSYLHEGKTWSSRVMYEMDEFGRFIRISVPDEAKRSFPVEIE